MMILASAFAQSDQNLHWALESKFLHVDNGDSIRGLLG